MSNTDASQSCLGSADVCRLGCVEFAYTSVSAQYVVHGPECQRDQLTFAVRQMELLTVEQMADAAGTSRQGLESHRRIPFVRCVIAVA